MSRVTSAVVTALLISMACLGIAGAADFPVRPVRIVTPYAGGGGIDILTRAIAQGLTQVWNQQVIVDNRPGAGSTIGNAAASKSAADGYTLLVGANAMAISPVVYPNLAYDLRRDFAPIVLVATSPEVLTVAPALGVGSVAELQARARRDARKLNFGSAGNGTLAHLAAESLNRRATLGGVHIAYKGSNPALVDLLAGQIDWLFDSPAAILPHVQAGRLRAIAVAAPKRTQQLPDVPTLAEAGFPDLEFLIWVGLMAPAGTPAPVLRQIETGVGEVLRDPAIRRSLGAQGWDVAGQGAREFAAFFEAEIAKLGEAAKAAGVKAE